MDFAFFAIAFNLKEMCAKMAKSVAEVLLIRHFRFYKAFLNQIISPCLF